MSREIRAVHDSTTIRVFQAYNAQIADAAVAANSFQGPLERGLWSLNRMTWIKPSACWMGYRCGWALFKDANQGRVLALDLSLPKFYELLARARLAEAAVTAKGQCKDSLVVVQWDPERYLDPTEQAPQMAYTGKSRDVRSIQIGLRGDAVQTLLDPEFVLRITDVTDRFTACGRALAAGDRDAAAAALWPEGEQERLVETVPQALQAALGMQE